MSSQWYLDFLESLVYLRPNFREDQTVFLQGTSSYEKSFHLKDSLLLDQIFKVFFTPHKIKKISSLNK